MKFSFDYGSEGEEEDEVLFAYLRLTKKFSKIKN